MDYVTLLRAAMRRIHEMENIFKVIKCAEEDKVVYAIAKLRSEALSVWRRDMVKVSSEPAAWTRGVNLKTCSKTSIVL